MARTLDEVDVALAAAETKITQLDNRVTQLINAGRDLRDELNTLVGRVDNLQSGGSNLANRVADLENMATRAAALVKRIKSEIRFQQDLPLPNGHPMPDNLSPRLKRVVSNGRVVARARSTR